MSLSPRLKPLFNTAITTVPYTTLDKFGKRTFAASLAASWAAKIEYETVLSRSPESRLVVDTGRALIYGDAGSVTSDYLLILGAGSASTTAASPVLVSVDVMDDDDGAHHTVIRFGR